MPDPQGTTERGAPLRPSEVVRRSATYLERHGVESPRATAEALLMHFLGTDRAGLYSRSEGLDSRTAKLFGRALCQRCGGVPLQHLTGEQQFMGLRLETRPGVFIPRAETEVLVGAALEALPGTTAPVVVDVGVGAGAVALALKQERPDARVIGTDASHEAVMLTLANARRHGLEVEAIRGDLLSPLPEALRGRVDLVVSNPPYVAREDYDSLPEEVRADPYDALVGGTEVHARLAREGPGWLAPGGWLVVEIGEDQGAEVKGLFSARLEGVEILPDLTWRDRVVRGRLPTGRESARAHDHLTP